MSAVLAQKRSVVIQPERVHLAEHARQDFVVNAEEGTTIEDVMDPQYLAHVAGKLQAFDRVEVRLETGEWTADFIVANCGRNWATLKMIAKHDLRVSEEDAVEAVPSPYEVRYRGPQLLHCVIRKSDGQTMQQGMRTKLEAMAWLAQFERTTSPG